MNSLFDVEKHCYNIADESGWKLEELPSILSRPKYYALGINLLNYSDIFIKAFSYAKKKEYLDRIIKTIIRKNTDGKELARIVFHAVFPNFRCLDDLYNYCYQLTLASKDMQIIANEVGISGPLITYYASESRMNKEQKMRAILKKQEEFRIKEPIYCQVIDFLLRTRDETKIIEFFLKLDMGLNIKKLFDIACILYPNVDFHYLNITLKGRMRIFQMYLRKKKHNEKAINTIERFVEDNLSIESFCQKVQVSVSVFYDYVGIVKQLNPELYEKYSLKGLSLQNDKDALEKIVKYIINGIDNREFTIVDYFKLTNRSVKSFFKCVKPYLDDNEYDIVFKFYSRYRNMTEFSINEALKEKIEINCDLDNRKTPIPNTGHVVTDDEKMVIIEKINSEGLPLYQPIYKYYLDEHFNKEKENVLKKTR